MSDTSSRNCFSRALLLANEDDKTRLRNLLGEINLSHLMKIAIESAQTPSEEELEELVDVWNGKPRRRRVVVYC